MSDSVGRFDADARVNEQCLRIIWAATGWPKGVAVDAMFRDLIRLARNEPLPIPDLSPLAEPRPLTAHERRTLEGLFKAWDRATRTVPYDPDAVRFAWYEYVDYGRTVGIPDPPNPYTS